jgi:probable rRNA maturation factor
VTARLSVFVRNDAGRKGVPIQRSFANWVAAIPELNRRRTEVNLLIVGSKEGRRFNREFRHKDYATNVLSFPYDPLAGESTPLLGDLVVCAPVVAREAAAQGKPLRDHYAHLTIHGVLHLLGHDHEKPAEAGRMEKLEIRILAGLGIPDPYV